MSSKDQFHEQIKKGYSQDYVSVILGGAVYLGENIPGLKVGVPLRMLNRHGLISGATGTGKTKTLQGFAEGLSEHGISCLMMDIKGDLSGLAVPGKSNTAIDERHKKIGIEWKGESYPVEFLSISHEKGVRMRATVLEFGPVLFSKLLELNDTQSGVISLVFKYSDDHHLPLLDLKDFKKVLQYLTNEGKQQIEKEYGRISSASTSTILRKIIEIEEQGAELFFGERSFDIKDLMRTDEKGRGYLNIIRLSDIQDRPKLFSTFMLSLLSEIYNTMPESGDKEKPSLVIFFDEAHLIFSEASKALLDQIESMIKLIRSKGVGVFFCTQQPTDVPASVLAQLGLKIQHALRAFTANDRKMIRTVAENYPLSDFYKTENLLTSLGIGEALVTSLNEKGIPSPLVHVTLCAPGSRMDILTSEEINEKISASELVKKYNEVIDRESAYEIMTARLEGQPAVENKKTSGKEKSEEGTLGDLIKTTAGRQVMRTVARELVRGFFGVLKRR